jgi:hypothetical protein
MAKHKKHTILSKKQTRLSPVFHKEERSGKAFYNLNTLRICSTTTKILMNAMVGMLGYTGKNLT